MRRLQPERKRFEGRSAVGRDEKLELRRRHLLLQLLDRILFSVKRRRIALHSRVRQPQLGEIGIEDLPRQVSLCRAHVDRHGAPPSGVLSIEVSQLAMRANWRA
jgi:hypothetical protein